MVSTSFRRPCHYILRPGGCRYGDSCKFSHDVHDENFRRRQPLCKYHLQGHCKSGGKCTFSHELGEQKNISSETTTQTSSPQTDLRTWRSSIPSDAKATRPLGHLIPRFFERGLQLVSCGPAIMQETIESLSSEGGLTRIKELVELQLEGLGDEHLTTIFTKNFLPFFRTITHPDVLASNVLEKHVGTIYNYLYGHGGQRALNLYRPLVGMFMSVSVDELADQIFENLQPDPATCLEVTIEVLVKIIDINRTASLNQDFNPVVEVLATALNGIESMVQGQHSLLRTRQKLSRIQQRFGLGLSLAVTTTGPNRSKQGKSPSFHIEIDGPGWLSKDGPRHDNDFEDISDITILPTSDEICSTRQAYLPVTDPTQLHLGGIEGLLDRHFRLLREDTVGQLRDAIRFEIENALDTNETKQHVRTHSYRNVNCVTIDFDGWKGLRLLIGFDQPQTLQKLNKDSAQDRKDWWEASKRLQAEALVCILSPGGAATFCTVVGFFELENGAASGEDPGNDRESEPDGGAQTGLLSHEEQGFSRKLLQKSNLYSQKHRAFIVLRLVQHNEYNVCQLFDLFRVDTGREQSLLIEFPGVLLPAFKPTLEALQHMSKSLDIPFAGLLAPPSRPSPDDSHHSPPYYTMDRNFRFDLSCLLHHNKTLTLSTRDQFDLNEFYQNTTLDNAQAFAVANALTSNVALIQGPPGTGKSFTGVALIKVLLANAKDAKIGPIVCVCYTNHALDQLLEQFLAHGVEQIIRIGSRSKSELLQPLNLRNVMKDMLQTPKEKKTRAGLVGKLAAETKNIRNILEQLGQSSSLSTIEQHLSAHYPEHYLQLFNDVDEAGFTLVYRKDNAINDWLAARHPRQSNFRRPVSRKFTRELAELCTTNVHEMNIQERRNLYQFWMSEIVSLLRDRLISSLSNYRTTKEEFDHVQDDLKLRCLQQANVIGLTTSGLARNVSLLRRLHSKVLLCEEAGEVLEAHLLTALLPSIEQAILLGDPQQLRPQIQNYDLSRENSGGKKYSLDMSLFERLIHPLGNSPELPYSVLKTQRRMHPSISRLVRETLYPTLEDAASVEGYPEVVGMRKRLFWLDHTHYEARKEEVGGTSHSNDFEVEMVVSLVTHLVRQSVYQPSDIAVLTPYLGQLHRLRRSAASQFEFMVNERDIKELEAAGMETTPPQTSQETSRTTLLNAIRIATVDNFQGEEAKIVVVSLVRSNAQNQCGFLKTSNRINVLLSRAQHGMYIIGNSQTSAGVKMWYDVLQILREGRNIGPELGLRCPRHPETSLNVSCPDDFLRLAPEGGCTEMCAQRLLCGHKCVSKCHSEGLHKATKCLEPCTRSKKGCDHACPKPCGELCDEKCTVKLNNLDITLACSHRVGTLPCWQAQDTSVVACKAKVSKTVPGCKHEVLVDCSSDVARPDFKCNATCATVLPCGHPCQKLCRQCRKRKEDDAVEVDHGSCESVCDRPYTTCSHRCAKFCHQNEGCPPCQKPCDVRCVHSKCAKKCSEPCAPCAESSCSSRCPHSACTMPCGAPCDWIPCSRRCEERLSCGHQCPSVCGERCPDARYCQLCASNEIRDTEVDFILGDTYKNIDLDEDPIVFPQCGHFLTLSNMDMQMDMARHYTMDENRTLTGLKGTSEPILDEHHPVKSCPHCRGSLRDISRYGRIVRRALLDEATKKFIIWANRDYVPLADKLPEIQEQLQNTSAEHSRALILTRTEKTTLGGSRSDQIHTIRNSRNAKRYRPGIMLRNRVEAHLNNVRVQEQPFRRVSDMVKTARLLHGTAHGTFSFNSRVLHTTSELRATALLFRCDIMLLSDFVKQRQELAASGLHGELAINLEHNREDCLAMIKVAQSAEDVLRQMEGHFFFASFVAVEQIIGFRSNTNLKDRALEHVKIAEALPADPVRDNFQGILAELKDVAQALNDGVFYSSVLTEEWKAIISAMSREFSTTGHWYHCANGHPFTVGECGRPMEETRCPECGAAVGGRQHRAAEGVEEIHDLRGRFGEMEI